MDEISAHTPQDWDVSRPGRASAARFVPSRSVELRIAQAYRTDPHALTRSQKTANPRRHRPGNAAAGGADDADCAPERLCGETVGAQLVCGVSAGATCPTLAWSNVGITGATRSEACLIADTKPIFRCEPDR